MAKNNKSLIHALPIPGCALIGIGIGFLTNEIVGFVSIGSGIGLLISYYMYNNSKK